MKILLSVFFFAHLELYGRYSLLNDMCMDTMTCNEYLFLRSYKYVDKISL